MYVFKPTIHDTHEQFVDTGSALLRPSPSVNLQHHLANLSIMKEGRMLKILGISDIHRFVTPATAYYARFNIKTNDCWCAKLILIKSQ